MADTDDDPITSGYVNAAGWLAHEGRPDLIDDVADQFERPDLSR